jgi:hypothetical protein
MGFSALAFIKPLNSCINYGLLLSALQEGHLKGYLLRGPYSSD